MHNLQSETLQAVAQMCPNFEYTLKENFIEAVRYGNLNVCRFLMSNMYRKSQYGFNKLHFHAIMTEEGEDFPIEVKKISISRASIFGSLTPVHLAAINPNMKVIEALLDWEDEKFQAEILEYGD